MKLEHLQQNQVELQVNWYPWHAPLCYMNLLQGIAQQGSSHLFRSCNWWSNSAWHTSNTKLWKTSEIEEAAEGYKYKERYRYKDFIFKNSLKLKNIVIDNIVTLWLSFVKDQSRKLQEYRSN